MAECVGAIFRQKFGAPETQKVGPQKPMQLLERSQSQVGGLSLGSSLKQQKFQKVLHYYFKKLCTFGFGILWSSVTSLAGPSAILGIAKISWGIAIAKTPRVSLHIFLMKRLVDNPRLLNL